MCIGLEWTFNF